MGSGARIVFDPESTVKTGQKPPKNLPKPEGVRISWQTDTIHDAQAVGERPVGRFGSPAFGLPI